MQTKYCFCGLASSMPCVRRRDLSECAFSRPRPQSPSSVSEAIFHGPIAAFPPCHLHGAKPCFSTAEHVKIFEARIEGPPSRRCEDAVRGPRQRLSHRVGRWRIQCASDNSPGVYEVAGLGRLGLRDRSDSNNKCCYDATRTSCDGTNDHDVFANSDETKHERYETKRDETKRKRKKRHENAF
jgi:hypothetical protein